VHLGPRADTLSRSEGDRHSWEGVLVVMLAPGRSEIRVSLSGAFELSRNGESLDLATPAQRVLAFLALHEHPVRRTHVAGALWLDSNEERAAGSLRSALWRIRQCGESIVESAQRGLRLSSTVSVDVRETVAWARRVGDPSHQVVAADVREAFAGADLLADWYDDWVLLERERLRQLRLHALEVLSHRLVSAGRYGEAMEVALTALRTEPLRESAHRAVISVHLAEGNRCEALRQYRSCRDLLRAQLDVEPSALMTKLVNVFDMPITAG
jgi:DNA-binding SARP family transcriptional activator